jgi:7-cyano-7-deazaguanine synthase
MKTVVLLSGGVDSTVVLANRLISGHDCTAVTFDYGQTHVREVQAARDIAKHYAVDHEIISLPEIFGPSALTSNAPIPRGHAETPDATTVPARNLVLIAIGASIADKIGATSLAFGANADDAAGYIDCRPAFLESLRDSIQLGTGNKVWLHLPLLHATKREIVAAGRELEIPFDLTWSCYRGGSHPCMTCGACVSLMEALMV